jgi:hypothetical protein
MQQATVTHLQAMGCPAGCQRAVEMAGLPTEFLDTLRGIAGFSWTGLVAFLEKYGPQLPALITDCAAVFIGGSIAWPTLIPLAIKISRQLPTLLSDFLAIFGQTTPTPVAP